MKAVDKKDQTVKVDPKSKVIGVKKQLEDSSQNATIRNIKTPKK